MWPKMWQLVEDGLSNLKSGKSEGLSDNMRGL